jgi:hypothetical protein
MRAYLQFIALPPLLLAGLVTYWLCARRAYRHVEGAIVWTVVA